MLFVTNHLWPSWIRTTCREIALELAACGSGHVFRPLCSVWMYQYHHPTVEHGKNVTAALEQPAAAFHPYGVHQWVKLVLADCEHTLTWCHFLQLVYLIKWCTEMIFEGCCWVHLLRPFFILNLSAIASSTSFFTMRHQAVSKWPVCVGMNERCNAQPACAWQCQLFCIGRSTCLACLLVPCGEISADVCYCQPVGLNCFARCE